MFVYLRKYLKLNPECDHVSKPLTHIQSKRREKLLYLFKDFGLMGSSYHGKNVPLSHQPKWIPVAT